MTTSHSKAWSAARPYFEARLKEDAFSKLVQAHTKRIAVAELGEFCFATRSRGEESLQRVASSLGIPTSDSNGGTFSRGHGKPNFATCFVSFHTLDAGADLVRFARVVRAFVVKEVYVFQMVRPYGEGSGSNGFSVVAFSHRSTDVDLRSTNIDIYLLMTSIPYHKSDVMLFCERDPLGDIRWLRDVDGDIVIVPQRTRNRSRGEGVAALIGEIRGHG